MNSTELPEGTEEKFDSKSIAIINAALIGLGVLITKWMTRKQELLYEELPPIIIKDGSFIIESDEDLYHSAQSPNTYKRRGFGEIKGVRVFTINEKTGRAVSDDYDDNNGVEVDIRLQRQILGVWQDIPGLVTVRTVNNAGNQKDFVLTIGKKLGKKVHPKHGRTDRYGDDDSENIRFGQIVVRENDGGGGTCNANEGDNFLIAFYKTTL